MSEKLKNVIKISVGQVVLKLLIKTCKTLFGDGLYAKIIKQF